MDPQRHKISEGLWLTEYPSTLIYSNNEGDVHRDGGPAIVCKGFNIWYRHNKRHREDGPAVEHDEPWLKHLNEWWLDGEKLTREAFLARSAPKSKPKAKPPQPRL